MHAGRAKTSDTGSSDDSSEVNSLEEATAGLSLDRDEVLAQAPDTEDGRFRVPPALGEAP